MRAELSTLGSLVGASAFALSLGGAFLFAGTRELDGHSLAGITLGGVALAWAAAAAVPYAVRRPHADLTDGLLGFGLAALAISTGLLAGGPGRACAFAAEAAMLVLVGERVGARRGNRRMRVTISAGIYLALTIAATTLVVLPLDQTISKVGAGTTAGTVALVATALSGIVFCFGTRWIPAREREITWTVPAVALGALPLWALPAEWAVVAFALMAAAVAMYRRTPALVSWLGEVTALVVASGWWLVGAIVALALTAPIDQLTGWDALGEHHGLLGLGVLLGGAVVLAWSVCRPVRAATEFGLLLPVATLAYVIAQALSVPYAMWAWLGVAAALALAVQVPRVRRALTAAALLVASGGMLLLGLVSAWVYDGSLRAIVDHGTTAGWESVALSAVAALCFACGFLDPVRRSYVLWLPLLLVGQLAAMLLPGQYPLVALAFVAMAVSVVVIAWPRPVRDRLDRTVLAGTSVVASGAVALIVVLAYETPRMLFHTTHTPATGLAAAVAATGAVLLAAIAARHTDWAIGRMPLWKILVYTGGAVATVDACRGDSRRRAVAGRRVVLGVGARPLPAGSRAGVDHLGAGRSGAGGGVASQRQQGGADRRYHAALRRARQAVRVRPGIPHGDGASGLVHRYRAGAAAGRSSAAALRGWKALRDAATALGERRPSPYGGRSRLVCKIRHKPGLAAGP